MRTIIPLNREWLFSKDDQSFDKDLNLDDFEHVEIPHSAVVIPYNNFDEAVMWGKFTYVRNIIIDDLMLNKHVILRFEGVGHKSDVYVDGTHVLTHEGGYIPFEVDLSTFATSKKEIQIKVIVDTRENPNIPPFGGVVDYLGYGGIYREVSLIVRDHGHISDLFIEQYGKPSFKVHAYTSIEGGELTLYILDHDDNELLKVSQKVTEEHSTFQVNLPECHLWDIDDPYLYQARVLYTHHENSDDLTINFGIREAVFKRDGFYLNQKKIKLQGLNRHQSFPYVGYAMPKRAQIEDADLIKYDLGCNVVRTSHYPQSIHFLNRCDEIGLLVFEEIPGWQHIGDEAWKEQTLKNLDSMIERDRNHPSIVLWGVRINESPDDDPFYMKTNAHAMALDPTRQRGGVRNFGKSHLFEDVYTYNDFSHFGDNRGIEKKEKIAGNVPYLVTEFNGHMYPTKRFDDEIHRVNHLKRHLRVLDDAYNPNNGVSGAIGWVFSDYNTHKEFGSGDKICYHGVMDMYRIPKIASLAYATQSEYKDILEVTSTMSLGDHEASNLGSIYVMTNLDEVKVYKNDVFIQTYKPDCKHYPNLIHAPIIMDDFIGESLMKNEKMREKDAELTKRVLKAVSKYGNHLPLMYKLQMLYILKKYKKTYDDAVKLYYTYMTGWGSKHNTYRFEGYRNGELSKVVHQSPVTETDLVLEHDGNDLVLGDTYDVKRYVIKKVDQNNQLLPYAFDALQIEVSGVIELIGPNTLSLIGGAIGFWVKASTKGEGFITITCGDHILIEEVNCL